TVLRKTLARISLLDGGPRGIEIRFRMKAREAMGGSRPELSTLIFTQLADRWTGQPFLNPVLNPGPLWRVTMQAAIAGNPHAVIPATAYERADAIKTVPRVRPIAPIEIPQLLRGRAPNGAVGKFGERQDVVGHRLIARGEARPFAIPITGCATLSSQPQ